MPLPEPPIDWLLAGEPWVEYRTRLDLLGQSEKDPQVGEPGMDEIVARILEPQSAEGPFQLPMTIPTHYGGTGQEDWAWALCDAPLLVYALVKFGMGNRSPVKAALSHLAGLLR